MKDKIQELVYLCSGSVTISINDHRSHYQSIEEEIEEVAIIGGESYVDLFEEIGRDVVQEMINRNQMVKIQFYPNTPIGFYMVYHWDVEKALDKCLDILNPEKE